MTRYYAVGAVVKELKITNGGQIQAIPASDFADGIVGFMPVFGSLEAAQAWGPDRHILGLEEE